MYLTKLMKYDYIILNNNYSGLFLSNYLSKMGKSVLLIDNDKTDTVYIDNNSINFNNLLTEYNQDDVKTIKLNFSYGEMVSIFTEICTLFFNSKNGKNITLNEFLEERNFSDDSKKTIYYLCNTILNGDKYTLYDFLQIINNHSFNLSYNFINIQKNKFYNMNIIEHKDIEIVNDTHNILSINGHEAEHYISDTNLNYDNVITINNNNYFNVNTMESQLINTLLLLHKLEPSTKTMFKVYEPDNIINIIKFMLLLTFIINIFNSIL